ncbi:inhibitor of the pro-sigma K processing machinery [Bacillus mesophilus]|uniref:Pro-sigmaK processing inhibitor BofA n=1 Tax=Bacillus mesophilus TaxID=1808955 RepID=A0A6M0QDD2_9BACI|nr:pro-sigmaK processing inhibitor BofA family protein [Bacillus mesophilus]MBM7663498.1 inhibitor of the pro-sigma K processing machinery [Bacillus mesophilus]NEY74217.1 pro-sigmaK processing inhibitor BofA [Bacillus mesophilus]
MEPTIILSILGGVIVLLLIVGAPIRPVRWIGQGLIKIMIGALLLFFLNAFGTMIDLHVPINLATSSVSGFFGIPGVVALIIIQTYIL